jgi:hypothetical protein
MRKLAVFLVAVVALALTAAIVSPNSAEAGWRRWAWRGPAVTVYADPALAYYGPGYAYYGPSYGPYRYAAAAYDYPYPYASYYPYWRARAWRGWY